jgi:hypothetical protein
MNSYEYLKAKQIQWALNRGKPLYGSADTRGERAYCSSVDNNLFEPLSARAREQIQSGDGGELKKKGDQKARMCAVHSSSILPVNVFHYWQSRGDFDAIASACGFCKSGSCPSNDLQFEAKFPIFDGSTRHPNLDVTFVNPPGSHYRFFSVESKFTEPYTSRGHSGVQGTYLEASKIWMGLPNLRRLAETISRDDSTYRRLHAAQLIKHILGLVRGSGGKGRFRLLYLWFDTLGKPGAEHREEIERFSDIAGQDGVKFHSMTYQELILRLADRCRPDHADYVGYLTSRYL